MNEGPYWVELNWIELNWIELNWATFQLTINQSVSQFVLVSSPSATPDQILAESKAVTGWRHGASFLTGGLVCLLHPTLYWSLIHWTLSGVSFTRPTWPSLDSPSLDPLESPLLDPLLESSSLSLSLKGPIFNNIWILPQIRLSH
jgi:hypothetical protein